MFYHFYWKSAMFGFSLALWHPCDVGCLWLFWYSLNEEIHSYAVDPIRRIWISFKFTKDGYHSPGKPCYRKKKKSVVQFIKISIPRAVASLTVPVGQGFHFPHFFTQILINISYFSSNFIYFLPHFGPPGGRLAHPGRPWLRHNHPRWPLVSIHKTNHILSY